jgi:hypothetical protein
MIRHVAELGALLLCFAVGVGLLAAFFVGLVWIWRSPESAIEDEYRQVENTGLEPPLLKMHTEITALPFDAYVPALSRPYNWATREPMIWNVPNA